MTLAHSKFKYQDQFIIEKMRIRAPYQYEAMFQNTGCFIYFKGDRPTIRSSEVNATLKSNEAVLLKCGTHFIDILKKTDNDEVEVIAVHLFPEVLKKLYVGKLPALIEQQTKNRGSQVVASSENITRFIDSLEFYFQNPSLVNDDLLELKIKELILLLVQSKNVNSIVELISDLYSTKTVQLKQVIELHLYSNLKIDQLAKLCNLSLSSFKREFKKEFSDSPNNYINGKKLEKAKDLLSNTALPISEIAYEVGFQDPLYFARLFKKKINTSPSNYRATN